VTTQIAASTIAGEEIAHEKDELLFARVALLDRFDRVGCFSLFARFESLRRERRWSVRSALSKYLIDREGFVVFFAGTDILLKTGLNCRMRLEQMECPPETIKSGLLSCCGSLSWRDCAGGAHRGSAREVAVLSSRTQC
jgi:hypothetical protein